VPGPVAEAHRAVQPLAGDVDAVVVGEQAQVDERMGLAEGRQARQQPADREGADHPDAEHLHHPAGREPLEHVAHAVEAVAHRRQQGQALVGQGQAARQTAEQAGAQPLLQALDLMADRRLGHAQLDGRPGEGQVPGRGLEGPQGVEGKLRAAHLETQIF
jgi:hypothetical protein